MKLKVSKVASVLGTLALAGILTACSSKNSTENIDAGMQAIKEIDYQTALACFDAAEEAGEDSKLLNRGRGIAYMGSVQYEAAIESFKEALAAGSNTPEKIDYDINYYLGVCYYKLGMLDDALARYDAIIDLKPKSVDAYFERASVYLAKGSHDAAIEDLEKAMALEPKNFSLCIDAYCVLSEAGFESDGVNYLQVAMDSNDKSMTDYDKGRMCFYLGDYSRARNYLEQARSAGEKSEDLMLYLGQSYKNLGDTAYTISMYEGFLGDNPSASIYNQLGMLYAADGNYELAIEAFDKGLSLEGTDTRQELLFNRIVAYENMGDFNSAKAMMSEYLVDYPNDKEAIKENNFLQTR